MSIGIFLHKENNPRRDALAFQRGLFCIEKLIY